MKSYPSGINEEMQRPGPRAESGPHVHRVEFADRLFCGVRVVLVSVSLLDEKRGPGRALENEAGSWAGRRVTWPGGLGSFTRSVDGVASPPAGRLFWKVFTSGDAVSSVLPRQDFLPADIQTQFAISRELIRNIYNSFHKLRDRAERMVSRTIDNAADLLIFGKELRQVTLVGSVGPVVWGGVSSPWWRAWSRKCVYHDDSCSDSFYPKGEGKGWGDEIAFRGKKRDGECRQSTGVPRRRGAPRCQDQT